MGSLYVLGAFFPPTACLKSTKADCSLPSAFVLYMCSLSNCPRWRKKRSLPEEDNSMDKKSITEFVHLKRKMK